MCDYDLFLHMYAYTYKFRVLQFWLTYTCGPPLATVRRVFVHIIVCASGLSKWLSGRQEDRITADLGDLRAVWGPQEH